MSACRGRPDVRDGSAVSPTLDFPARDIGGENGGEAALDGHKSAFPACLAEAVEEPIDYSLFEVRT